MNDEPKAAMLGGATPQLPRVWRDLKPDAQPFDEVRIVTVPRWKESYLSGDEWRISGEIQFYRKGKLVHTSGGRNVETCCYMVGARLLEAQDDGKAFFAGEDDICDQEGCAALATTTYRKLADYDRSSGNKSEIHPDTVKIRKFCDRHKRRGDCGLDDADVNYVEFTAPSAPTKGE